LPRDREGRNSIFAFFPYHVFVCVNSVYSVYLVHGKNQRHHKRNKVELKGVFDPPPHQERTVQRFQIFEKISAFRFSVFTQSNHGWFACKGWLIITRPNNRQDIEVFSQFSLGQIIH